MKNKKTIKYDYNAIGDIIIGNEDLDSKEQEQFSNYIENTNNIQKKNNIFQSSTNDRFRFLYSITI